MFKTIKSLTIFTLMISCAVTFAGTFEGGGGPSKENSVYKPFSSKKEIPNRQLNLVLRNHLYKAKVKHPSSRIKLFDACKNGSHIESISKAPRTHCVDWKETEAIVNNVQVKKLTCRYWSKHMSFKNAVKYAKRHPNECKLVLGSKHPNQSLYGNRPNEMVPLCDYRKKVVDQFNSTQRIEVYNMKESTANSIYYRDIDSDKAQPGYFRYKYTMPVCN